MVDKFITKENLDIDSAYITGPKTTNTIIVFKDPKFPSLFCLKWKTGASPEEFDCKFTSKEDATLAGESYMSKMKYTQAQKNKETKERFEKKKAKELLEGE
ncbi:MAG: hypothetical protein JKY50_00110 [Oleispira sp.]|nr:hypothetical protein [Oleispira sp.]